MNNVSINPNGYYYGENYCMTNSECSDMPKNMIILPPTKTVTAIGDILRRNYKR